MLLARAAVCVCKKEELESVPAYQIRSAFGFQEEIYIYSGSQCGDTNIT